MKTTQKILALLTAGAIGLSGTANAILIQTLQAGNGSLTIGDKTFDQFSISGFNPGDIDVTVGTDGSGNYTIQFAGGLINSGANAATDTRLFYRVTASGNNLISAIDQSFNLTAGGNGGLIAIGETVFTGGFNGNLAAQSSVGYNFGPLDANDPPGELLQGDQLVVQVNGVDSPQVQLYVTKDIFLDADTGGTVGSTVVIQSFHQVVPDGGLTLVLLGAALTGIGFLRRKFSA